MNTDSPTPEGVASAPSTLARQLMGFVFAVLLVIPLGIFYREFFARDQASKAIQIRRGPYQGWSNALFIASSTVEAIVVPSVGRVMQFRFVGEEGPFWENPALSGKSPDPTSTDWGNFGGDKSWPSPQEAWGRWTPRAWPPPPAFDSMAVEGVIKEGQVLLRSPVDPFFRIRTERVIRIDPEEPKMVITTRFEKVDADAPAGGAVVTNEVGVWIITQLKDPQAVFLPIPSDSLYPEGYNRQSEALPLDLTRSENLLSLKRNPGAAHKIGSDSSTLLWIGERIALRIDSPRSKEARYPDQGSSAEVYTNPDPLSYVELEMLGPLHLLKPGDVIYQTNSYLLIRRTEPTAEAEARRILGR